MINPRNAAKDFHISIRGRKGTVFVERWPDGWEVWVRWQDERRNRLTTKMNEHQAVSFLAGMKGLAALIKGNDFLYVPPRDQI